MFLVTIVDENPLFRPWECSKNEEFHWFVSDILFYFLPHFCNILDQSLSLQISQYFYFLFAPTLLYRDHYPRTSTIQWEIVGKMFGQFVTVLVLVYHIIVNFWMPIFLRFFTDDELTVEMTISSIFELMLPGVLIVILGKIEFFILKRRILN